MNTRGPRRLVLVLLALVAIWAGGFLWFSLGLPRETALPDEVNVDGIVVFTGSPGRIDAGLAILAAGRGRRLLVSGVDPDLATATIRAAIAADDLVFDCCIELGRAALDTEGNAAEAVAWAQAAGFSSLALVTSDWHVRRSMLEISRLDHHLGIHAVAVPSGAPAGRLFLEYNKFLLAALRALLLPPHALAGPSE